MENVFEPSFEQMQYYFFITTFMHVWMSNYCK